MSGVPVLAAIWSAVPLPSGAVSAFALTEQDPPFLSHVVAEKSSEYFAMFSYGPPADPNGPHSMEFRCESRYAHRLLAAAYAKFAPPDPSRRTTVPAVAFAVASVICEDVCVWTDAALPARAVTRPVMSASACVWVSGALPARSVVRLVTSASAWVWPGTDASAMVTFTRSLAGTSRNVSPMFAPGSGLTHGASRPPRHCSGSRTGAIRTRCPQPRACGWAGRQRPGARQPSCAPTSPRSPWYRCQARRRRPRAR